MFICLPKKWTCYNSRRTKIKSQLYQICETVEGTARPPYGMPISGVSLILYQALHWQIASPLHELTRKGIPFKWTETCQTLRASWWKLQYWHILTWINHLLWRLMPAYIEWVLFYRIVGFICEVQFLRILHFYILAVIFAIIKFANCVIAI